MYALQCKRTADVELLMGEFFVIDKHDLKYAEIGFPSWMSVTLTKGSFISRNDDKICDSINKARIFETKKDAVAYLRSNVQIDSEVDKHLVTSLAAVKRLLDIVPIAIVRA